jgi:hypothetical protein
VPGSLSSRGSYFRYTVSTSAGSPKEDRRGPIPISCLIHELGRDIRCTLFYFLSSLHHFILILAKKRVILVGGCSGADLLSSSFSLRLQCRDHYGIPHCSVTEASKAATGGIVQLGEMKASLSKESLKLTN